MEADDWNIAELDQLAVEQINERNARAMQPLRAKPKPPPPPPVTPEPSVPQPEPTCMDRLVAAFRLVVFVLRDPPDEQPKREHRSNHR